MTLWATRDESLQALDTTLRREAQVLAECFALLDDAITRLESLKDETMFTRAAAVVLVKARNLGLACYSLALDGLGQEGGAVFRPLVEALELLTYFRLDPQRAALAVDGTLPRAGEIARAVEGTFRGIRDYLNTHASHFAFSWEALRHLIDNETGELKKAQQFREPVLRSNLAVLSAILVILNVEGVNCIQVHKIGSANDLADRVEGTRDMARDVFKSVIPVPTPRDPAAAV